MRFSSRGLKKGIFSKFCINLAANTIGEKNLEKFSISTDIASTRKAYFLEFFTWKKIEQKADLVTKTT